MGGRRIQKCLKERKTKEKNKTFTIRQSVSHWYTDNKSRAPEGKIPEEVNNNNKRKKRKKRFVSIFFQPERKNNTDE